MVNSGRLKHVILYLTPTNSKGYAFNVFVS